MQQFVDGLVTVLALDRFVCRCYMEQAQQVVCSVSRTHSRRSIAWMRTPGRHSPILESTDSCSCRLQIMADPDVMLRALHKWLLFAIVYNQDIDTYSDVLVDEYIFFACCGSMARSRMIQAIDGRPLRPIGPQPPLHLLYPCTSTNTWQPRLTKPCTTATASHHVRLWELH